MPRSSWPLTLVCGSLIVALSVGVRQVSGVLLNPVSVELGLSREAFGFAVAVQNIVWGLTQPVAGLLADRFGAARVSIAGGLAYGVGLALSAQAGSTAGFLVGYGVMCGLGQAGTAYAVILAVIGRAAPAERRARAVGLASTAGSVGMFLLVPLTSTLLETLGWRGALACLAAALSLTPVLALGLREPPAAAAASHPAVGVLLDTLRDRDFWLLNLGFAACGFQLAFLATYLPVVLLDGGLPVTAGAAVLAAIGLANVPGSYLSGVAGGRWRKSHVLAAVYAARGALMVAFLALPLSAGTAVAFGLCIGLLWSGTVPLTSGLVGDLWGRAHLGLLFGLTYVGHQTGAFLGAFAGGFVYERSGSFGPVWAVAIAVSFASSALHLTLRSPPVDEEALA